MELITIYFKTTPIIFKFFEQCILPRIMPLSKCLFVVNINFVRHHTKTAHCHNLLVPLRRNSPFQDHKRFKPNVCLKYHLYLQQKSKSNYLLQVLTTTDKSHGKPARCHNLLAALRRNASLQDHKRFRPTKNLRRAFAVDSVPSTGERAVFRPLHDAFRDIRFLVLVHRFYLAHDVGSHDNSHPDSLLMSS